MPATCSNPATTSLVKFSLSNASQLTASPAPIPSYIRRAPTDDGSVSHMSDTASKLFEFESHFNKVTGDLSAALHQIQLQSEVQARE
jgi:hypothetical protein